MSFNIFVFVVLVSVSEIFSTELTDNAIDSEYSAPCTCGIFLTGQFKKGSKDEPTGNAAILQELDQPFPNNSIGIRQCTNKCLETMVKHLPSSAPIICATIDRDCHKERAYLFIQNHSPLWRNTKLSAGREYCCKDNEPYKCPL